MLPIKDQINSIIAKRQQLLTSIDKKISAINKFQISFSELDNNVKSLLSKDDLPESLRQQCENIRQSSVSDYIIDSLQALQSLKKRYSRTTINIGVAGKARVGKSTFLQNLSGLTNKQIPAGSGLPVTASRSRILNSTNKKATISFYSESDFCDKVLKPYYEELDLGNPPHNLEEFVSSDLNINEDDNNSNAKKSDFLNTLKLMQSSVPSYRKYLRSENTEQEFSLDEIEKFVAYPKPMEDNTPSKDRPYLAVKEVKIECDFPENDVKNLGMIDLPGLGENVPKDVRSSFINYKSEVDLIVLVTRPNKDSAFWGREDIAALSSANEAKGPIKLNGNFSMIVVNDGDVEKEADTLFNDINQRVNNGNNGENYYILRGNVKDSEDLRGNIVQKIMEHLAEKLPIMDAEYEANSIENINKIISESSSLLEKLQDAVKKNTSIGSNANEIVEKAEELQQDLAWKLNELLDEYKLKINDTEGFENTVESHKENLKKWIESLGCNSPEEWKTKAKRAIKTARGSGGFIDNEYNKIRNHISHSYSGMNVYMNDKIMELRKAISKCIKDCTKNLVDAELGNDYLKQLRYICDNAIEPCNTMIATLDALLNYSIEYMSHFHPIVRESLEDLYSANHLPENVKPNDEEIDQLFTYFSDLATSVNDKTNKTLCEESKKPNWILYCWLEEFEDRFIRDKTSATEFRSLVQSYKESIWPEEYSQIASFNAELGKIAKAAASALDTIEDIRSLMK